MKKNLQMINDELMQVLELISENNENGKQMDYCTHPSLTNEIDQLIRIAEEIENMWYQK